MQHRFHARARMHSEVTYIWADATVAGKYSSDACGDQGANWHRLETTVSNEPHNHDTQGHDAGRRGNGLRVEGARRG